MPEDAESFHQSDTGQNDPEWDYTQCRCENNGDLCDYCQRFEEMDLEEES
jgi:hypothetical protein